MQKPPKAKVFLEGRYKKLSRELPQTVFYCPDCKGHPRRRRGCERCEGFGKLTRESVQELIGWVAGKAFGTRKNKFHGAGREDVDVRMLGNGRPFILELLGPKTLSVDLAELEAEINRRNEDKLEIQGLHWTEKSRVQAIKETPHAKEYGARVHIDGDVPADRIEDVLGRRLDVVQGTPSRVAHRRAQLDRTRWIEFTRIEQQPDGLWDVHLLTQHGTYVKEVLSGEEGRTKPSLSSLLGVPCRCEELDVLAILDSEGLPEAEYSGPPPFGAGLK